MGIKIEGPRDSLFRTYGGLSLDPEIESHELALAKMECGLPDGERVLALLKIPSGDQVLFGETQIWMNTMGSSPGPHRLSYAEFLGRPVSARGTVITFGANQYFRAPGYRGDALARTFEILKEVVRRYPAVAGPAATLPSPPPPPTGSAFARRLLDLMGGWVGLKADVHFDPAIPPKKLFNARKSCAVPPSDRILALIDGTVFGSAKVCMLFGEQNLYAAGGWTAKFPGAHRISYEKLARQEIVTIGDEVIFGPSQGFPTSGSALGAEDVHQLLASVQRLVREGGG